MALPLSRGPWLRAGILGGAALVLAACAPGATPPLEPPAPVDLEADVTAPPPATSLVSYTAPQAERGQETFQAVCSACHAPGEFRGTMFRVTWMTRPIGHFFQLIGTTMPQDAPGSLSPAEYAAVVAYVLQLNGAAEGREELPADIEVLEELAWPQEAGPGPLVRNVGAMQIGICIHICIGGTVRTTLDLDRTLLEEAREALGASTFTEAIEMALRQALARTRGAEAWKVLEGSDLSWGSPEELSDYRRKLGGRSF